MRPSHVPHLLRALRMAALCALLAGLSGCMQINTLVQLKADGSADITERVRFSRRLLDLGEKAGGELNIASLLEEAAAQKRMANMGEGITLTSHKIEDVEGGARESVTVYHIADANNFTYVSPFLAYTDYASNNKVKLTVKPIYEGTWWGRRAGKMAVSFDYIKKPEGPPQLKEGEKPPPGPTPAELQVIRELRPIFKDIMKDFRLKLSFESYAPLSSSNIGHRGSKAGTKRADLLNFSDQDLDNWGGNFLENEEIMVELLRWNLGGHNVVSHTKGFVSNQTLPVFLPTIPRAGEIYFAPSQDLFDKHFEGKKITFYYEKGPQKTRPATFKEIGHKEKP